MADPILWHKLKTNGTSEIGPNPGFIGSLAFDAVGPFGDCVNCDADALINFYTMTFGPAFVFSFFWIPGYTTYPGYVPIWMEDDGHGFQVNAYGGLIRFGMAYTYYTFNPPSFSVGDKIHIAFVCDSSAGDTNRLKCYWNNVPLSSVNRYVDSPWSSVTLEVSLSSNLYSGIQYNAGGGMANFKVYDYARNDFSWDMAHEGLESGPGPTPTIITRRHSAHYN